MNADLFPPSPTQVPAGLTAPSKSYVRHARLAMVGLLAFVAVYLGLTGYLAWVVYRLLGNAVLHGGNVFAAGLLSIPALFFLAFLLRGLFVVKHVNDDSLVEVKPAQQPALFAFLHRLADETKAPRPHRVYLSARVNAAVFYDLSFFNLLLPSKKNLELGLGLVNVVTLDELKAVIAHEYGHFAQRTMAVGRWVYVAQQIAGHIVMSRGVFDRFLSSISRTDIRIAWVGWIARLFVWAIRAVLDTSFRLAAMAHRALGREMEFQADRVAVSVSGSDSLVHALHRLAPADEAWEDAANFVAREKRFGRELPDLFTVHSAALDHLRHLRDEPTWGVPPKRPDDARASSHRVFDAQLAHPPRMWMTHPPNREREDSAKEVYVPSALDDRAAWVLFQNVDTLRRDVTAALVTKVERAAEPPALEPNAGTALDRFAKRFGRPSYDPRYRGAYLGRQIAAWDKDPFTLIGDVPSVDRTTLLEQLGALYPTSLRADLAAYRERREEESMLQGLVDGVLTAPGGVVRYRGREIRRKELPGVVATAKHERREVEGRILEHDRMCRALHLAAAEQLGQGWSEHLQGLVKLLHFATQAQRNLGDVHSYLNHVLNIAILDGRVSSAERARLLTVAQQEFEVLTSLWAAKAEVVAPSDVEARMPKYGGWGALSEPLGLLAPHESNLGDWLNVCEGWASGALYGLDALHDATLDLLLEIETQLAGWLRDGVTPPAAPTPAKVPARYDTCVVGQERERQKKLGWWDRFQIADGLVPGIARVGVACALLLPALMVGGHVGSATLHLVNGLNTAVTVQVGSQSMSVQPKQTDTFDLEGSGSTHVIAITDDGRLIEEFDADVGGGFAHVGYNIGQAAPLMEFTLHYRNGTPDTPRQLGAPRWLDLSQDYKFTEPPRSLSLKNSDTGERSLIEAMLKQPANVQRYLAKTDDDRFAMTRSHLLFDPADAPDTVDWWLFAKSDPRLAEALAERAEQEPANELLQYLRFDATEGAARTALCAQQRAVAERAAGGDVVVTMAARCETDDARRVELFEAAMQRLPKSGFVAWNVAQNRALEGRWKESLQAWAVALEDRRLAGVHHLVLPVAVRTQRIARALGAQLGGVPDVGQLGHGKPGYLTEVQRPEYPAKADEPPDITAYRALLRGQLTDALNAAPRSQGVLAMVAASDGADAATLARALALAVSDELDFSHSAVMAALTAREGRAGEAWLKQAGLTEPVVPLVQHALQTKLPADVESAARRTQTLRERETVLMMGVVLLGSKAPAPWRTEVKAGLFAQEHPYFR